MFSGIPNETVGIAGGCGWYCHFTYQFFHASWLHLAVNCWALLCLVFYYETPMKDLAIAFVSSASVPTSLIPSPEGVVTIGVSGVVFALMGMLAFSVRRRVFYNAWIIGFIVLGFFFKSCNSWLHLYCYAAGFAVALLRRRC